MQPITVLIWTCIIVFIITSGITILALLGIIKLGGQDANRSDFYLKKLFGVLIVEIAIVGVAAFASNIKLNEKYINDLEGQIADQEPKAVAIDSLDFRADTATKSVNKDTVLSVKKNLKNTKLKKWFAKKIVRDTLEVSVLATTDKPTQDTKVITIPKGSKYLEHRTIEHSKNKNASYKVDLINNAQRVEAVRITASVGPQILFGPRNWVRATLQVFVERQE